MKVLLVQCPVYDAEMPPLGLAYLAAALRNRKMQVEILDINIDFFSSHQEYRKFWSPENYEYCMPSNFFLDKKELDSITEIYAKKIIDSKAQAVGFSVQATSSRFSVALSERIKALDPSKIIVFGGPECSRESQSGFFLKNPGKADYLVFGEGEEALPELLEISFQGNDISQCRGIAWKKGEQIFYSKPRMPLADLDKLAQADFSLFKLANYLHQDSLPVITSRGCLRRCVFCFDTWHQGVYRKRSCQKIVDEINDLYDNYSLRRLKFNDLLINGDIKLLDELCDNIISLQLFDLFWSGNIITREGMTKELFEKMYRAGCRTLTLGLETASAPVLKKMGKYFSLKETRRMLKDITESGIHVSTNWIVGFPGETRRDLYDTMKFITKNKNLIYSASPANRLEIIRGSSLYKDTEGLNIRFSSSNSWEFEGNNEEERIKRQRVLNDFMSLMGILNQSQNAGLEYAKEEVGFIKSRRNLAVFKKKLNL